MQLGAYPVAFCCFIQFDAAFWTFSLFCWRVDALEDTHFIFPWNFCKDPESWEILLKKASCINELF